MIGIDRVYVKRDAGLPLVNTGDLQGFFNLPSETRIYSDEAYFLAINISVVSNITANNPRFLTVIEFENFEVTNPRIESVEGGENFEYTTTLESGDRSVTSTTQFPLANGNNIEIDYYLIYQIFPQIEGEELEISSKVTIAFDQSESDNFDILGRYQSGILFNINIEKRV